VSGNGAGVTLAGAAGFAAGLAGAAFFTGALAGAAAPGWANKASATATIPQLRRIRLSLIISSVNAQGGGWRKVLPDESVFQEWEE
jgi:hypothetical protein